MKKTLIICATILVAINTGTLQAQEDRSIDYAAKYSDAYWAKRGYYRNDYGHAYFKVNDERLSRKPVVEQVKSKPEAKATPEPSRFVKTNTAAETLFAAKLAERH